jgi:hypothetical protein
VTLRGAAASAACHRAFVVSSPDVASEVGRLAAGCAGASNGHRVGETLTGRQSAGEPARVFRVRARAGRCYRGFGVAAPTVPSFLLLLTDGSSVPLAQDGEDDGAPVAPRGGSLCFGKDGELGVVASVGDGEGAFAVEIWEE